MIENLALVLLTNYIDSIHDNRLSIDEQESHRVQFELALSKRDDNLGFNLTTLLNQYINLALNQLSEISSVSHRWIWQQINNNYSDALSNISSMKILDLYQNLHDQLVRYYIINFVITRGLSREFVKNFSRHVFPDFKHISAMLDIYFDIQALRDYGLDDVLDDHILNMLTPRYWRRNSEYFSEAQRFFRHRLEYLQDSSIGLRLIDMFNLANEDNET